MFEFELGAQVKDNITAFTGIVVARCEHLNGCIRYGIQARKLKESGGVLEEWFDEQNLSESGKGIKIRQKTTAAERPGGPRTTPPGACSDPK